MPVSVLRPEEDTGVLLYCSLLPPLRQGLSLNLEPGWQLHLIILLSLFFHNSGVACCWFVFVLFCVLRQGFFAAALDVLELSVVPELCF